MPVLPDVRLAVIAEDAVGDPGFLQVVRRRLRAHYPDGTISPEFAYDEVQRSALDAVVLAAHFQARGERFVYLRSAVRPPLQFRRNYLHPSQRQLPSRSGLWELPAGLVEPDEESAEGVFRCAQRELYEELGFKVEAESLRPLGPSTFPCPGVIAERHFFFEIGVTPSERLEPVLDGSALEHAGLVISARLEDALAWCQDGTIEDAKTELGLRRLAALSADAALSAEPGRGATER